MYRSRGEVYNLTGAPHPRETPIYRNETERRSYHCIVDYHTLGTWCADPTLLLTIKYGQRDRRA